jgi:two-component system response regulator YcbB
MPKIDGINIVKRIKKIDSNIRFIMISEVFNKDMVSKAYAADIEYYISKPVNVIEATTIIKKVIEKIKTYEKLSSYEENQSKISKPKEQTQVTLNEIIEVLNRVGATGKGKVDLANIIFRIIEKNESALFYNHNMSYYYADLRKFYLINYDLDIKEKTIKQRIRRGANDALESIASLGLEDYFNSTFEKYASTLFKFSEVRKEMEYLKGTTKTKGKIDIKRFIGGVVNDLLT